MLFARETFCDVTADMYAVDASLDSAHSLKPVLDEDCMRDRWGDPGSLIAAAAASGGAAGAVSPTLVLELLRRRNDHIRSIAMRWRDAGVRYASCALANSGCLISFGHLRKVAISSAVASIG